MKEMNKLLIVIDMQNDLICNSSVPEDTMSSVVSNVVNKIKNWEGDIVTVKQTHNNDIYYDNDTNDYTPINRCIIGTFGWRINERIIDAIEDKECSGIHVSSISKNTLVNPNLYNYMDIYKYDYIELVGLYTDTDIIAHALYLKSFKDYAWIRVDSKCCYSTVPENQSKALSIMQSCGIDVI